MHNENYFKPKLKIPDWELEFTAARSSGPGGQNVNKTATKVTLRFKVNESKTLSSEQKKMIYNKLAGTLTKQGEIVISEQSSRSQWTNRQTVIRRLNDLVNQALIPEKERGKTRVPAKEKEKRLTEKKKHSAIKKARSKIDLE